MAYYYCILWDCRKKIIILLSIAWIFTYIPGMTMGIISGVEYYSELFCVTVHDITNYCCYIQRICIIFPVSMYAS